MLSPSHSVQCQTGRRPLACSAAEEVLCPCSVPDSGTGGSEGLKFTHREFHTNAMLSVIASLTPYSDYNQSPRNMYQCQMAKQTMGTPVQVRPSQRSPVPGKPVSLMFGICWCQIAKQTTGKPVQMLSASLHKGLM